MSMRRPAAGYWACALAFVLSAAGLVFYWLNAGTRYFVNLGMDPLVLGCTAAAMVVYLLVMAIGRRREGLMTDVLFIAGAVLVTLAMAAFAASRVNGFASIMTFEYSAQNMADLSSAITGVGLYAAALIMGIAASFLHVGRA